MEVVSWHCREEMVFDLIIEVSAPPAGEGSSGDVCGGTCLESGPIRFLIIRHMHRNVRHLRSPCEPMAL